MLFCPSYPALHHSPLCQSLQYLFEACPELLFISRFSCPAEALLTCQYPSLIPVNLPLLALRPTIDRLELLGVGLEEVHQLLWVLPGDVDEGACADVVGLASAHQAVVLEEILAFRLVMVALSVEDLLRFSSVRRLISRVGAEMAEMAERTEVSTYSEIESKLISVPRASVAACASSSPAASIGPESVSGWGSKPGERYLPVKVMSWPRCSAAKPCSLCPERTCAATRATSYI